MNHLALSHALKFRWINGQCFEFRFNNGRTLMTDPWYRSEEEGILKKMSLPGFSTEDIRGADYVFLNHSHGDHICNLQEVYDKFQSTVIVHSAVAIELARTHAIPMTSIYPVNYEGTYYFDGFILETHHGTHHAQKPTYKEQMDRAKQAGSERQRLADINAMGSIFNMNFVLTTDQGMRIAFIGGNDDGMLARLQGVKRPNIVIRNKMASSNVKQNVAEDFAAWFAEADTQLLVPMHYETWLTEDPEFAEKVLTNMNRIMEDQGKIGRIAPMIRGKWYTLDLAITEVE
ncbi:hypothetical protein F220043C3_41460 [Enterocloster asparagiformis]|uniref:MBL fold metallo-hydrolase n=1 Tax=Enterocloster asparagiformis TaxID=333367 RepID=UPI0034AC3A41